MQRSTIGSASTTIGSSCTTIGIVAHVDAGKTSLTERLLFDTGVTHHLGAVDSGDTQTDSGDIERRRGITIRTGVVAFHLGDLRVTLVDTPGHAEFVAEVERALAVLDAAVLVVSAVEGIQSHTRLLMKTLAGLGIPTVLFVNKLDRRAARTDDLVADIRDRLTAGVLPVNTATAAGTSEVSTRSRWPDQPEFLGDALQLLALHDDAMLRAVVDGPPPSGAEVRSSLREQVRLGRIHPLVLGSARTGVGVSDLLTVIRELMPRAEARPDAPPRGRVFAFDRSGGPGKTARPLVRVDQGMLRVRDHVSLLRHLRDGGIDVTRHRVTKVEVIGGSEGTARGGDIVRLTGLGAVQVGDALRADDGGALDALDTGDAVELRGLPALPRPDLQTVVRPRDPADAPRMFQALALLGAQDPLISMDVADEGAARVLLFGEVQQEVLGATLAEDFGVEVTFEDAQLRHLERPIGTGTGRCDGYPLGMSAVVGFRIDPGPHGSGLTYRLEVELGALLVSFHTAIRETVRQSLGQGLSGWPVTDIVVTVVETIYDSVSSTAGDFRRATPLALFAALRRAGTAVFEPLHAFDVEIPPDCVGPVLAALSRHEAQVAESALAGSVWRVRGEIPLRRIPTLRHALPGLTRGEGAWVAVPGGDRRLSAGEVPTAPRHDGNPLDEETYLRYLRGW
jgi:ribosomal protection tetracycline resistance protein